MEIAVFIDGHDIWPLLRHTLRSANNAQDGVITNALSPATFIHAFAGMWPHPKLKVLWYAIIGAAFCHWTHNWQASMLSVNVTRWHYRQIVRVFWFCIYKGSPYGNEIEFQHRITKRDEQSCCNIAGTIDILCSVHLINVPISASHACLAQCKPFRHTGYQSPL